MFKRKDDIRTFVVIGIICVLCVGVMLILSIKSNYDKLQYVTEYNVFFSSVNYVNKYLNYIASGDKESIYNVLDDKYIEKNDINENNVLDKIDNYSFDTFLNADNMKYVQIGNNFIYYIEGKIYKNTYYGKELIDNSFSIVLISDFSNMSYSIYPINDSNYKKIINGIKKVNVKNNKYNSIEGSTLISKEQVCVIYLADFMDRINDNIENSYELLSDDMKEKYTTSDSYIKYINDNKSLLSYTADRCKLEEIDDKRVYTVVDSNQNTYKFTEDIIMNYEVDFYLKKVTE